MTISRIIHSGTKRDGQAFIALILLIGSIILSVGVMLAYVVLSTVAASYGYQAAQIAEAAATAGAEDAIVQINRNGFSFGSPSQVSYSVQAGKNIAAVTVVQSGGIATVVSAATVSSVTRKIRVVLSLNPVTGLASIASWQDIQ